MNNFAVNRSKLKNILEDNQMAVVFSGNPVQKLGDEYFPFTPNRNFYYLTGLDRPKMIYFVYKFNGDIEEYIAIERYDEIKAKWVGAVMLPDEVRQISDIQQVIYLDEFEENISSIIFNKRIQKLYLDLENRDFYANTPAIDFANEIKNKYNYVTIENLFNIMADFRMEKGLSFLEFNYMIMQSYDFFNLYKEYGCNMQFGGDDQWSNMLGGTELIRRKLGKDAYAMTITLLLNSEGKKMGKTQSGAVWLDPKKTSPYDFYQYWRNVADADVLKCLRMLTFLPLEQIDEMDKWEGSQLNKAKEILAYELTALVHGEEEAKKADTAAKSLFAGGAKGGSVPTTEITKDELGEGLQIIEVLEKCKLIPSRGEGRRLVQQGGVRVNEEKVTDIGTVITAEMCDEDGIIMIQKGKKTFHQLKVK